MSRWLLGFILEDNIFKILINCFRQKLKSNSIKQLTLFIFDADKIETRFCKETEPTDPLLCFKVNIVVSMPSETKIKRLNKYGHVIHRFCIYSWVYTWSERDVQIVVVWLIWCRFWSFTERFCYLPSEYLGWAYILSFQRILSLHINSCIIKV